MTRVPTALRRASELTRFAARRATAWARLRPTFLVIGAQRSGTTSLNDYLAAHPAILSAVVKEVQYFHRYYEKGDRWYRARFPLVDPRERSCAAEPASRPPSARRHPTTCSILAPRRGCTRSILE